MPKTKNASKIKVNPTNATDRRNDLEENKSSAKYQWFELLLYPQDEEQNKNESVLRYVTTTKYQYEKCIYITHDRDKKEDGSLKKSHVHCIIKCSERITCNQLKQRLVFLKYEPHHTENQIRPITEGLSEALLYLTHESFRAKMEKKILYDKKDLKGDSELINQITIQNKNYIQNEIYELIKESPYTIDVIKSAESQYSKSTSMAIIEEFQRKGAYYQTICREEQNRRRIPQVYKPQNDVYLQIEAEDIPKLFEKLKERKEK